MSGYKLAGRKAVRHFDAKRLVFSFLTEEEIRRLSVAKIYKPYAFDKLGLNYPEKGGLYDPALGPLDENSPPCETCGLGVMKCVGHFGHIELPLTVVNPLCHKILFILLRITCRKCFSLQIPSHEKLLLVAKLKLLGENFLSDIYELEQEVCSSLPQTGQGEEAHAYVQDMINSYIQNLYNRERFKASSETEDYNTRNFNAEFQAHIDQTLKNCRIGKVCMYCHEPFLKISTSGNKIMTPKIGNETLVDGQGVIHKQNIVPILPDQSREYLRKLWINEKEVLKAIVPVLGSTDMTFPTDIFFHDILSVLPPVVRPVNMLNGQMVENPRTLAYKYIIQNCLILRKILQDLKNSSTRNENSENEGEDQEEENKPKPKEKNNDETMRLLENVRGATLIEKLHHSWEDLQVNVNHLVDREMNKTTESATCIGVKQVLEKKGGIIRMHMMGKRVNYAARTVITPDPYLDIDEIGVPEAFALKLTYPVPVTPWNVTELRKMVINGPDVHPGAVLIQNEDGSIRRISSDSLSQRESIAKTLLTKTAKSNKFFDGVKIVHRHLQNGDMLLLNRQPTLHKPSIMAHKARVLKAEKTLRLHYANCKAYNADFDGDEMNAHFPQNEIARSEAKFIANTANQYLVPKDGTPLSGLIQDHIISGVKLSMRGRFFEKEHYQSLIYSALWSVQGDLILLPPAIIKPKQLWSGKQVISTVIMNLIPRGRAMINLTGSAKIGTKEWTSTKPRRPNCGSLPKDPKSMSEAEVVIRGGELLCGVLDKAHYGATTFGFIHCIYELYGANCATKMLSAFGKLFQNYLLHQGFTLGVRDILVTDAADKRRKEIINECRKIGDEIQRSILEVSKDTPMDEILERMEKETATNAKFQALVDRKYKSALDVYTNDINKTCLPAGLIQKFPHNNLQLMVQSGAKGSTVNTMQISCLLGQIELEGKRPPLMISGKSLPSFAAFDPSPRAGGFIDGRFMTGIQPQEFFFHCMAGREGLIDTAVKTSRSGYLQRCLIKHLEGISVQYDSTVRDADGSLIQFYYGEDGLDISRSRFINVHQLDFLMENKHAIMNQELVDHLKSDSDRRIAKHQKKIKKWESKHGSRMSKKRSSPFALFSAENINESSSKRNQFNSGSGRSKSSISLMKKWIRLEEEDRKVFEEKSQRCPDPLTSKYRQDVEFGVVCEKIEKVMEDYMKSRHGVDKNELKDLIGVKVMKSLCPPGETVGLLAAQSIGEPSTQMTLNTFHFAGRGEMNVTLGIPRLREILMMASKNIKTPSMEIPFKKDIPKLAKRVEEVRRKLTKCVLSDVVEDIDVNGHISYKPTRQLIYTIKLNFLPKRFYKHEFHTNPADIIEQTEARFFKEMFREIKKVAKGTGAIIYVEENKKTDEEENAQLDADDDELFVKRKSKDTGETHESSDEEQIDEADATAARSISRHQENQEYDDPEDEDVDMEDKEEMRIKDEDSNLNKEDEDDADVKQVPISDRRTKVVNAYSSAIGYDYDEEKLEWCSLTFALPLKMYTMDLQPILRNVAKKIVLWETPSIKRAFTFQNAEGETILKTDGINIIEMFKYNEILQLNKLYSNDIYGISQTYGIEAANRVIVKEVKDVFKMYGITVDLRHLSLVADYMTYDGHFKPMSRKGMEFSASPLQQISFESSLQFLKNAILQGKCDDLNSPSSRLMVGQPCRTGTGAMDLLLDVNKIIESQETSTVW